MRQEYQRKNVASASATRLYRLAGISLINADAAISESAAASEKVFRFVLLLRHTTIKTKSKAKTNAVCTLTSWFFNEKFFGV